MDTKKIAELLMSGIKENLIICGYLFQNMEQAEIDEVFKEVYLEIDSIFEHSDGIDDFYNKVDREYFIVHWIFQCIVLNPSLSENMDSPIKRYKINFYSNPSKEAIVPFLTNL